MFTYIIDTEVKGHAQLPAVCKCQLYHVSLLASERLGKNRDGDVVCRLRSQEQIRGRVPCRGDRAKTETGVQWDEIEPRKWPSAYSGTTGHFPPRPPTTVILCPSVASTVCALTRCSWSVERSDIAYHTYVRT